MSQIHKYCPGAIKVVVAKMWKFVLKAFRRAPDLR